MTNFRKAPLIAILALAVECGLSINPSHAGQKVDPACVASSLGGALHERFTPEGEMANASRLKLQEKLKRPPHVQIGFEVGRELYHLPRAAKTSVAVMYESGNRIGSLEFHTEGDLLQIGRMDTTPDFQRLGVGSTLFETVVKTNPHVKKIRETLADDNEIEMHKALAQHLPPEAAIRETPAYKIPARLGFGRIVPGSVYDISEWGTGRYQIVVERP